MANIILLSLISFISLIPSLDTRRFHPLHVSVVEIEHDKESKALEMTMRIFIDDLELSIRNDIKEPRLDLTMPAKGYSTDKLLEDYLRKNFTIKVNGKEQEYTYIGHEIELPILYLYVQSEKIKKINSVEIFNSMIMETYDDQTNIIHVEVDGKIKSMKLNEKQKRDILSF